MSSHTYSTELIPEPLLRRAVIAGGAVAAFAGLTMILTMPLDWQWRAALALAWSSLNTRQLLGLGRGHRRCQRMRIGHGGDVTILTPDGCCLPATLLPKSLVLPTVAWLRFESENGQRFAELVRRQSPQDQQWRRLQVIWRHLGAAS